MPYFYLKLDEVRPTQNWTKFVTFIYLKLDGVRPLTQNCCLTRQQ